MPDRESNQSRRLLCFVLFERARLWLSDDPDATLPAVLDAARVWPQKIEHDGSEFLLIEKSVLRNWERPKNSTELVNCLSERPMEQSGLEDRTAETRAPTPSARETK